MSHPLEDRDGRWVVTFTRDLGHPVEADHGFPELRDGYRKLLGV